MHHRVPFYLSSVLTIARRPKRCAESFEPIVLTDGGAAG